jgi:MraZ protein
MSDSAKVDLKGRLRIPGHLLPTSNVPGNEFYITSEDGCCVQIYPMRVWNQVEDKLQRQSVHSIDHKKLLVRAKYFGQVVTMDGQGRVLIPIILRDSARMNGPVNILDYVNYLEVWNHAQIERNLTSSPITRRGQRILNDVVSVPRSRGTRHATGNKRKGRVHATLKGFGARRQVHA